MTAIGAIDIEIRLAMQALRQGDGAGAEQRLKAALRAQPRPPRVLSVLGAFLVAEKRYREAEPILRAATKAPQASDATDFHLGLALQNLDRPQEAFAAFGKALAAARPHLRDRVTSAEGRLQLFVVADGPRASRNGPRNGS